MLITLRHHIQQHPVAFVAFVALVCFGVFSFVPVTGLLGLFVQTFILGVFTLGCLFLWNPSTCLIPTTKNATFTLRKTAYLLTVALTLGLISVALVFLFELETDPSQLKYLPLLVLLCLFTGIFEESLFRGILFPLFARELDRSDHSTLLAALASALLFGFLHVSGSLAVSDLTDPIIIGQAIMKTTQAGTFGFFMAALFFTTKNIWMVALVHGAYNLLTMWPVLISPEDQMGTYLTGSPADLITLTIIVVAFIPLIPASIKLLRPT